MTNKVRKFKMWKRRKSINYRQENAGTSCLGSKTGSSDIFGFTMVFRIPRSPLPEKAVWIKQLQAGKWGHFLFGEQNRKWQHLWLHHSVPYPEIPPPWENGGNQSITGRKMQALPVWRAKQEVKSFWTSPTCSASLETPILKKTAWINQYMAGKCWHFLYSSKVCWLPSLLPTDISLAKVRICLLEMLGGYSEKQKLRR